MTGTIMKLIKTILIISVLILPACTKYHCVSDTNCERKVNWNDPTFTIVRTIITNGANVGK